MSFNIADVKFKVGNFVFFLTKRRNNFFCTVLDNNDMKKLYVIKSCGMLPGIRGSKKYTTVAVETLGKDLYVYLYSLGFKEMVIQIKCTFKINKFLRAFIRGLMIYGKKHIKASIYFYLKTSHNGVRPRKKRRV